MRWALLALLLIVGGSAFLLSQHQGSTGDARPLGEAGSQQQPWLLGAVTTQQGTAQELSAEFFVPQGQPSVADVYYPLLLSAYDSNSSYDQIGILAQFGKWVVTTSNTEVIGGRAVYNSKSWAELVPGFYSFRLDVSKGAVTYTVERQSGETVMSETERTGGDYFIIAPSYFDRYTLSSFSGFTVFEEVYNASLGSPQFGSYCSQSSYVSNGTKVEASWSEYRWGNVPAGPMVALNGSAVIIRNEPPSATVVSPRSDYFTKEPISLSAIEVGGVGSLTYTWYLDGAPKASTTDPEYNFSISTAGTHGVRVEVRDLVGVFSSVGLDLEVRKIWLDLFSPNGTASGGGYYDFGNSVTVTAAPLWITTGTGTRIALVGWTSDTPDGYSGLNAGFTLMLKHNVTERAIWEKECLVSFDSGQAGLTLGASWYPQGNENITLPSAWGNDSGSRMSLTGYTMGGTYVAVNRTGSWILTDLEGPLSITLSGVKQYSVILQGYDGPCSSNSQTGDLWFDVGTNAQLTMPPNYTQGFVRWVFTGWQDGSEDLTIIFPSIAASHTFVPEFRSQYFVIITGGSEFSNIQVDMTTILLPPYGGMSGVWVDNGSLLPLPIAMKNQQGDNGTRFRLTGVVVSTQAYVSSTGFIHGVTGSGGYVTFGNSWEYAVIGSRINESSGQLVGGYLVEVNGTYVIPTPPSDQTPKFVDGQVLVDKPLQVGYVSVPEYYFDLKVPGGGSSGWVAGLAGLFGSRLAPPYTFTAPLMAGFLSTQRFVRWEGTVNSSKMSLVLPVNGPYSETAVYSTDVAAVLCVLLVTAILAAGTYGLIARKFAYRGPE